MREKLSYEYIPAKKSEVSIIYTPLPKLKPLEVNSKS